jgi:RsiW-degrading membrane proteinase PrsW (M82 family)
MGERQLLQRSLPDLDERRRNLGVALFLAGTSIGTVLLALSLLVPPLSTNNPIDQYATMFVGALLAFPAGLVYLTVPRLLDRYDPEPWYALVGCLAWGGLAACGFSVTINSLVSGLATAVGGARAGLVVAAVVSAPLTEEFWKGLGVLGVFWFLRREFDGVVDGIMYATFTALGFATVENVVYYAEAAQQGGGTLAGTFFLRGILAPWGHPLYTSMFGIGVGIARETVRPAMRVLAPLCGYFGAVALHAAWNGSAVFAGFTGGAFFLFTLPLWLLFVAGFLVLVVALVVRRGRIIRRFLEDEVYVGTLSADELELVGSAFGLSRARARYGQAGVDFVRAAARLGLSKWHSVRAMKSSKHTVSTAFVVPLRQRLAELRQQIQARARTR